IFSRSLVSRSLRSSSLRCGDLHRALAGRSAETRASDRARALQSLARLGARIRLVGSKKKMDDDDVPSRPIPFEELRMRAKRMDRNLHDFGRYARAAQTRVASLKAS